MDPFDTFNNLPPKAATSNLNSSTAAVPIVNDIFSIPSAPTLSNDLIFDSLRPSTLNPQCQSNTSSLLDFDYNFSLPPPPQSTIPTVSSSLIPDNLSYNLLSAQITVPPTPAPSLADDLYPTFSTDSMISVTTPSSTTHNYFSYPDDIFGAISPTGQLTKQQDETFASLPNALNPFSSELPGVLPTTLPSSSVSQTLVDPFDIFSALPAVPISERDVSFETTRVAHDLEYEPASANILDFFQSSPVQAQVEEQKAEFLFQQSDIIYPTTNQDNTHLAFEDKGVTTTKIIDEDVESKANVYQEDPAIALARLRAIYNIEAEPEVEDEDDDNEEEEEVKPKVPLSVTKVPVPAQAITPLAYEGEVLARVSNMSLVTKDWHLMYWRIDDNTLKLFNNKEDFIKKYQPKKKILLKHNLRVVTIKRKEYNGIGNVYNFMMEEVNDYGAVNVGKFASETEGPLMALWMSLKARIVELRSQVKETNKGEISPIMARMGL